MPAIISTKLTELLKIEHPVLLAGMNSVASAELAAAVSNAGGLGSIGGVSLKPKQLRKELKELKAKLNDKTAFGVDLLLPQVGDGARKTNYDYTGGHLGELVDIIIEEGARLFISAVGVPPRWVVERLHKAGILCMNMVGHPKHVKKALDVGIDLICCQGSEGGGHTGDVGSMVLLPMCLDAVKGRKSELTGGDIMVVAAGGIYDGRTMAAALAMGAEAVWVGTRFVASEEATTPQRHKKAVVEASATSTVRTLIYTGRPLRVNKTPFIMDWEARPEKIKELTSQGVLPYKWDQERTQKEGGKWSIAKTFPLLMGQVSGAIHDVLPAKDIVLGMTRDAAAILQSRTRGIVVGAKL